MSSFSLNSPLSLYSIPAMWLTTFYPMNMKFALIQKYIGYNNVQPRSNTKRMSESGTVAKDVARRAERLEGAHLNGTEMLPLWASAVLAGNFAGIDNETLNVASAAFLSLRILYNYVYTNQSSETSSWVRSGIWATGLGIPLYLLIKAANLVKSRA